MTQHRLHGLFCQPLPLSPSRPGRSSTPTTPTSHVSRACTGSIRSARGATWGRSTREPHVCGQPREWSVSRGARIRRLARRYFLATALELMRGRVQVGESASRRERGGHPAVDVGVQGGASAPSESAAESARVLRQRRLM